MKANWSYTTPKGLTWRSSFLVEKDSDCLNLVLCVVLLFVKFSTKTLTAGGGFKACILYSSSMGCDVFARVPQTDERRMVSHTTTTVKLLCKRWQQLKRKACNYLRSIAPPRRRIAPRGRSWAEQQYEQQGGEDGGSIMVHNYTFWVEGASRSS